MHGTEAPEADHPGAEHGELAPLFGRSGPLARAFPGYRERPAQVEMAAHILRAIRARGTAVLEAGTGVGKTAAYLVPALLEGGKVIISTGTKTLQDQLFHRDLPAVKAALAMPVQTALLKGRANYVCHWHLERCEQHEFLESRQEVRDLQSVKLFMQATRSGDKAECATVPDDARIWSRVTSTRDNCLGSECPKLAECFVMKARAQAQDADIVVVNHHLFFADLMLRDEGINQLLPSAQTVIFDEAHQIPDVATQFFGDSVSSHQVLDFSRDCLAEGLTHARDAADWNLLLAPLDHTVRELRLSLPAGGARIGPDQLRANADFHDQVDRLKSALAAVNAVLGTQAERGPQLANLHRRGAEMLERLALWNAPQRAAEPELCWVEAGSHSVQLHRTPVSVADIFRRQRLQTGTADEASPPDSEGGRADQAWIFTSATLSVKGDFRHFTRELGLEDALTRAWGSPFDYPRQAVLCVPEHLPPPQSPDHTQALVDAVAPLIRANGGRAFFLCTTLRAVERAAARLRDALGGQASAFKVLEQGTASRARLLEQFREPGQSVLVGSQSFWEGIDVRGDALTLVIIDKLPFSPPDDPVLAKRMELLEQSGGQPFMDYQVPEAIITLKQGAGRLIRSESDQGVLLIGDVRLITKPYGRRIWQSLPPMRRTRHIEEAEAFLKGLDGHREADPQDGT